MKKNSQAIAIRCNDIRWMKHSYCDCLFWRCRFFSIHINRKNNAQIYLYVDILLEFRFQLFYVKCLFGESKGWIHRQISERVSEKKYINFINNCFEKLLLIENPSTTLNLQFMLYSNDDNKEMKSLPMIGPTVIWYFFKLRRSCRSSIFDTSMPTSNA